MKAEKLDTLLAAWAARHDLAPERAGAIHAGIPRGAQQPGTPLSLEWWERFQKGLSETLSGTIDPMLFLPPVMAGGRP